MNRLSENWLTDGVIDFEYKKYILLAYLKSVNSNFTANKLYPYLGDLVKHYQNLLEFIRNREAAKEAFPKELKEVDLKNFMLSYRNVIQDDELMKELERIVNFSAPRMKEFLDEGREIYEWLEDRLILQPVGILPLDQQFGYLFIRNGQEKDTKVYRYKMSLIKTVSENFRSLHTNFLSSYTTSTTSTYEAIKRKVIERERLLIAPAVYLVESEFKLPFSETLLPLSRRMLITLLTKQDQVG